MPFEPDASAGGFMPDEPATSPSKKEEKKLAAIVGDKAYATALGARSLLEPLNPVAAGINTVLRKTLGGHLGIPEAKKGLGDTWQEEMQNFRKAKAWAQKESPVGYTAGALASGLAGGSAIPMVASGMASSAPGVAGMGERALGAVLDSAAFNAASAGGANLDRDALGAASEAARDPANLVAAVPTLASEGAPLLRKALEAKATNIGRRVLLGGYTPMSVKKPLDEKVIRAADEAGAFLPFGTTKGAHKRLESRAGDVGDEYGAIVAGLEKAGVEGPSARALMMDSLAESRAARANTDTAASPRAQIFEDFANEILTKPTPGKKLGGNLGLTQAENIKRSQQQAAKEEYIKLRQNVGARGVAEMDKASMMRQAVEDAIEKQSAKAPELAAQFAPVKEELANLIRARNAAEVGASRQAHRRALTPYDMAAIAGGMAHGSLPAGAATAAGVHLAGSRLPSTATWGLYRMANRLPENMTPAEARSIEEMIALSNALRSAKEE